SVAYGETPAYDGATPTKAADSEYTYTFNAWTPAIATVTTAATYTATYSTTKVQYTLTWVTDGNELTGSYTTGTMDWGASITAPDTPTKPGKDFAGWRSSISSNVEDPASTMPTQDLTYTATWTDAAVRTLDLYDDRDATYYNNIKALNGQTYDVTYHRSVKYESDNGNARWYTLCLPFNADQSQLAAAGMLINAKIYEYRYAKGSADENDHVTFHFRAATSIIAGRGYLVKATGDMGPDFTFENVTLNTSADTKTDVNDLKGVNAYYDESVGSSEIVIVGVLRSGTLSNDDRKVMGLANNKIWYPHSSGNPMPAYRAYFYNPNASASSVMPRVRIVVEGEDTTELEVVDGELYDAGGDRQAYRAPSKYIRNGVLIIERNGVRYDAQGKRL
ncbi:MAG: InlB B-repeat-containing protein, partial [Paludibacteraceae bacterium]|nr:InlB B-repeat-containing protein [Paludibacteraceae bacterium]